MKIVRKLLRLVMSLSFLLSPGPITAQIATQTTVPAHKAVLLLFPYQFDLPATALALQAIQAEFGQGATRAFLSSHTPPRSLHEETLSHH